MQKLVETLILYTALTLFTLGAVLYGLPVVTDAVSGILVGAAHAGEVRR